MAVSSVEETTIAPLSPNGYDLTNNTQAGDFLVALLDDTVLQLTGNDLAVWFWIGVAIAVVVFAMSRGAQWLILDMCKRRVARLHTPDQRILNAILTPTRALRMVSYMQLNHRVQFSLFNLPPVGVTTVILAYVALVLGLLFGSQAVAGAQHWQALGVYSGWLALAQIPLVILLTAKKNLITLLTGVSYERLNVLHRWASRIMLLLVIFHVAFQVHGWTQFRNVLHLEWTTDACVPTGLAATSLLLWMNVSTIRPLRNLSYELFVVQHILTFFGFIVAMGYHLPTTAINTRIWLYIAVGFYVFGRLLHAAAFAFINRRSNTATLTYLPGDVTKVQVHCASIKAWRPGSHMLTSLPALGLGQSHPATIASTPESHQGDLVFMLKGHKGFTRRLYKAAKTGSRQYRILLDGPYGGLNADFSAFSSVCLIAGSTGITFIMSTVLALAHTSSLGEKRVPLRRIHVVWAVKDREHLSWARAELALAFQKLYQSGIESTCRFFITGNKTSASLLSDKDNTTTPSDAEPDTFNGENNITLGRPDLNGMIEQWVSEAEGELGISVCGPRSMNAGVRNAVTRFGWRSNLYLHVEGFAY